MPLRVTYVDVLGIVPFWTATEHFALIAHVQQRLMIIKMTCSLTQKNSHLLIQVRTQFSLQS